MQVSAIGSNDNWHVASIQVCFILNQAFQEAESFFEACVREDNFFSLKCFLHASFCNWF